MPLGTLATNLIPARGKKTWEMALAEAAMLICKVEKEARQKLYIEYDEVLRILAQWSQCTVKEYASR